MRDSIIIRPQISPSVLFVLLLPIGVLIGVLSSHRLTREEVAFVGAVCFLGLGLVMFNAMWVIFAREILTVRGTVLRIEVKTPLGLYRRADFNVVEMKNLRIEKREYRRRGRTQIGRQIAFDYDGDIIRTTVWLSNKDAEEALAGLKECLRSR